jgi:hypothetical protein
MNKSLETYSKRGITNGMPAGNFMYSREFFNARKFVITYYLYSFHTFHLQNTLIKVKNLAVLIKEK